MSGRVMIISGFIKEEFLGQFRYIIGKGVGRVGWQTEAKEEFSEVFPDFRLDVRDWKWV